MCQNNTNNLSESVKIISLPVDQKKTIGCLRDSIELICCGRQLTIIFKFSPCILPCRLAFHIDIIHNHI